MAALPFTLPNHLNTKVLFIGVSKYADPSLAEVPGVVNDIELMKKTFMDPNILGIPESNILAVLNPGSANLTAMLGMSANTIEPSDLHIIYYGGHGIQGKNGDIYLSTTQTTLKNFEQEALPVLSLLNIAKRSTASALIILLDCSFSGRVVAKLQKGGPDRTIPDNVAIITASGEEEQAIDSGTTFPVLLINALLQGNPEAGELLNLSDICKTISRDARLKNAPTPLYLIGKNADIAIMVNHGFRSPDSSSGENNPGGDTNQNSSDNAGDQTEAGTNQPQIENRLHSDMFNLDEGDVLGYDLHAFNLFSIMVDAQTTPPVNIGILAPWGRGKTSLMRRIEDLFVKQRALETKPSKLSTPPKATLAELKKWLHGSEPIATQKIPYPTVWFNPWNYQSSEMIWAGMAFAVIDQVVSQLPTQAERELFWFRLRLARIDKEELRKELQLRASLYVMQFIIWGITGICTLILWLTNATPGATISMLGFGAIFGTISSVASKLKPNEKDIREVFDKYTKAPQYLTKLGTFHDVQEDLKKVFDLLIDEKHPLVIFVDDLDRCSPAKVVEVVEAINVFISGEYCKKTYFVLGMDAEIVSASLDVAYEKMKGRVISRENEQGSLGWYFLDKFVQLPFFIPVVSEEKKIEYLNVLFSLKAKDEKPAADKKVEAETGEPSAAAKMAGNILASQSVSDNKELLAPLTAEEENEVDKEILKQQIAGKDDNEAINKEISRYAGYISSDPRSLKRFANLLRFYNGYQVLRMKKGQKHLPIEFLGKYIVIMLKFPQMVRWLQWDSENKSASYSSAPSKSLLIDSALRDLRANFDKSEWNKVWLDKDFQEKKKAKLTDSLKALILLQSEMNWLCSEALLNILLIEASEGATIDNALKCNLW